MSLLSIVQDAAEQLSLAKPSRVVGASDADAALFLRAANQEGRALAKRHGWQRLTKEVVLTATGPSFSPALPADFDRMVNGSFFHRTQRRAIKGPLTPGEWQDIEGRVVAVITPHYRIRGNAILFTPDPGVGDVSAYEYITRNWCASSTGTEQQRWAADTDVGLLDEGLMTLGVVWRFRQAKGYEYGEDYAEYERQVADAIVNDGSRRILRADGPTNEFRPADPYFGDIQVTSW